jgi:hypothetical protein
VWEALPVIESLIEYLEKIKKIYTQESHPHLTTSINLAWSKIDDYYKKLDEAPAYAAALVLHPRFRFHYFINKWKGSLKKYLALTKKAIQTLYEQEYKPQVPGREEEEEEASFLNNYIEEALPDTVEDKWKYYINGNSERIPTGETLYEWWNKQTSIPGVRQMAFNYIFIPAMSAELERVFNDTKLTISLTRTRLGVDIVEAEECLRVWHRADIWRQHGGDSEVLSTPLY